MSDTVFRVHPAIGIGRVGDSEEFYIAPVTAAGTIEPSGLMGGLPIKPGTEDTPITADDFRDSDGNVKRQAARFRIYAYPAGSSGTYPNGGGTLVTVGGSIGGKKVVDIVWTVHLANKKLNNYSTVSIKDGKEVFFGIGAYEGLSTLVLRTLGYKGTTNKDDPVRLRELFIDPGPRAIKASGGTAAAVAFDAATPAAYANASAVIVPVPTYPKSFPSDFNTLYEPLGPLTSLGDLRVDDKGGLVVAGGYARTVAVSKDGQPVDPLTQATENGQWYDDAADGPVNAVIVFDDNTTAAVQAGWYVTGDPGYAPQTRNIISVWDDVYDVWVRELGLVPSLYANGQYQASYKPSFPDDIQPIFHACMLQRWNTNLPSVAVSNHDMIGAIKPTDDPTSKIPNLKTLLRDPNSTADTATGAPMMPLSLGDANKSFLSVSQTQYCLLTQWHAKTYLPGPGPALGPGEILDKITLENCLGGRYSPGIEVSFPIRDVNLFIQDWQKQDCGPFRINQAPLDYSKATADKPFLTFGYIPLQAIPVEPGDISKAMSVPWHTDYNSCATHLPDPNPQGNNTLFWSWPAERPVAVYPVSLCQYDAGSKTWAVGQQIYSVRGAGTDTDYPAQVGRFQKYPDFVDNWFKVGFVIEASQIAASAGNAPYPNNIFLEVQSKFDVGSDYVPPWPTADVPHYKAPPPERGR
ncbi:MAG TPA: LodA/GoxA family CTQ-dependent oxidase [Acetobacteraceae bacterium]|nr:LodA/GoxA family CTQ-dependent oxidase [Acetobacteraceae bacterium]